MDEYFLVEKTPYQVFDKVKDIFKFSTGVKELYHIATRLT